MVFLRSGTFVPFELFRNESSDSKPGKEEQKPSVFKTIEFDSPESLEKPPKMPSEADKEYLERYKKLSRNGLIIGWVGEFLSIAGLILSAATLTYRYELAEYIVKQMHKESDNCGFKQSVVNLLAVFCSAAYGFALVNILVCSLLLVGTIKRCSMLLLPWLIYHGLFLFFALIIGSYAVYLSLIYMCIVTFLYGFFIFITLMAIFVKIFSDIFELAYVMNKLPITENGNILPTAELGNAVYIM